MVFGCLIPLLIGILLLGIWELLAARGAISRLFFPAPSATFQALLEFVQDGTLLDAIMTSLGRLIVGLSIGLGSGFALGIAMARFSNLRRVIDPYIALAHPLPITAILPFLIVLLGVGDRPRIAAITLAAFFPMLINTTSGVGQIDATYFEVGRSYKMRPWQIFWRIIIQGSLPTLLTGLRLSFNSGMTLLVVTELLTARDGIGGGLIITGWRTLELTRLFAGLIVLGLIGVSFNQLIKWFIRYRMPWYMAGTDPDE